MHLPLPPSSSARLRPLHRLHRIALLCLLMAAAAASTSAASPAGTWTIRLETPDQRTFESTLNLTVNNGRLTGSVDNRAGKADIKDGTISGDEITFKVERTFGRFLRKKTITTHYRATVEGDLLKGVIETRGRDDRPVSIPFEATRA